MMGIIGRFRLFLTLHTISLLVFGVFLASACSAWTLHECSMEMMAALEQKTSAKEFTFVVLGDSRDNEVVFKKSLELAATFKPLFIIHDGDFSSNGTLQEVDHFLDTIRAAVPDIPFFIVMGNHERRQLFQEKIGPQNFVIDSARLGFKLIAVDNSNYALKRTELDYLKENLKGERKLAFVVMHIPPRTKRWARHTFSEGASDMVRLLSEKKVSAAFYGHVHLYDKDELEGVPYIITGGAGAPLVRVGFPGEPVYHIVVVKVKDGAVQYGKVNIQQ